MPMCIWQSVCVGVVFGVWAQLGWVASQLYEGGEICETNDWRIVMAGFMMDVRSSVWMCRM